MSNTLVTLCLPSVLCFSLIVGIGSPVAQQRAPVVSSADTDREIRHQSAEWQSIAAHLPDPATATPKSLQTAADVLRARRMPEDALDYYQFALNRGGDEATLENSIGVTQLELRNSDAAIVAFKRAVQLQKKNGKGWNNLGSAEFTRGNLRGALVDYLRAVSLDKKAAVYRSNLASVYFELKDYESARMQFQKAIRLDRNVFREGGFAGTSAHMISLSDRGRFCFEMAKMSAQLRDDPTVLNWLAKSSESGFDIMEAMSADRDFNPYVKDPRVSMIIKNAKAMRTGKPGSSPVTPIPDPKDATSLDKIGQR